jgi:hypothetical protein
MTGSPIQREISIHTDIAGEKPEHPLVFIPGEALPSLAPRLLHLPPFLPTVGKDYTLHRNL